jgi:predicted lipoprotein
MGQRIRTLFILLAAVVAGGCTNDSGDSSEPAAFDFTAMLQHSVDEMILPAYESFQARAAELAGESGSVQAYCEAIGTADEAAARQAAQSDWRAAMDAWQKTELHIVGPAAANGAFLRNRINAFDENLRLSTCAADQAVVLAQEPGFDITARSVNHRGLVVLEYLLFNDDLTHTCPSQISETQDWNSLGETERKRQRCEYAALAADDMADAVDALIAGWQPDSGNFRAEFLDPARAEVFYAAVRKYYPGLKDGAIEPGYAGIRPKVSPKGTQAADFVIQGPAAHGVPGLVNLFAIESPGLTASWRWPKRSSWPCVMKSAARLDPDLQR